MTEARSKELRQVAQLLHICSAACMDMLGEEPLTNLHISTIALSLVPKTDRFFDLHQQLITFLEAE